MARFDRTIPPGGEGKITLQVRTKGYQGKLHKKAQVLSNDPKQPQLIIGLQGEVWVPVNINPRYVRLMGTEDEEVQSVLYIQGKKKEPLVAELALVSIPKRVDVKLLEIEKGRTYQLMVKNKVQGETRYRGELKLTTNYPEKPEIVIQVVCDIRGRLEVRPKVLNFGRMSQKRLSEIKGNKGTMNRSVTVLLNKGNDLKIEKVELEKSLFKASAKQIKGGQRVQILVEPILEKLKKGANLDRLKIYTNQKDSKALEVPIRFDII